MPNRTIEDDRAIMSLPLSPPLKPELALSRKTLPEGEDFLYEVKLDGFRCIAFVDGEDVFLQSRNGKTLGRYFPELAFPPGRYVLDGEIVVRDADGRESFDALGQRVHPAVSRVQRLAVETPAIFIAFDLLAHEDDSWLEQPFAQRRAGLERLLSEDYFEEAPIELMVSVDTPEEAEPWLRKAEGVIAKQRSAPYLPGERKGMVKIKRVRTADTVVVAFRMGKEPNTVGSLILGLYDDDGELHVVGHTSGFKAKEKRKLLQFLEPYRTHEQGSGEPSRWKPEEELLWEGLRPELVCEIAFDHITGNRIRHGTKLLRWREDKDPRECLMDQLRA
jgi:ATP-dependent DNA ligase